MIYSNYFQARSLDSRTLSIFSVNKLIGTLYLVVDKFNFCLTCHHWALSDPTRRRILELLRDRDLTAGELADHFNLAKPTLSGHFNVLKQADLIQADKKGSTITYHLNISVLEDAMLLLMSNFKLSIKYPLPLKYDGIVIYW